MCENCDYCMNNGCFGCCACGGSFETEVQGSAEVNGPITIWITRDALTKGIMEAQGAHPTLGSTTGSMNWGMDTYRHDEYELDKTLARIKAIRLKSARIVQLEAELDRLERLEF